MTPCVEKLEYELKEERETFERTLLLSISGVQFFRTDFCKTFFQ